MKKDANLSFRSLKKEDKTQTQAPPLATSGKEKKKIRQNQTTTRIKEQEEEKGRV